MDSEKITSDITDTHVATGSEMLATGTSNEVSNISTQVEIESDSMEFSDYNLNDSASPLKVSPVMEEIKKEIIDVQASNVDALCKN